MSNRTEWTLQAQLPVKFTLYTADDLFERGHPTFLPAGESSGQCRRLVVIDEVVYSLHGERIEQFFLRSGIDYRIVPVVSTESTKDLDTLLTILSAMENFHLLRQSEPVIGIGGGALLDILGFAASMYRRGVPFIKIPTTLVGLVDVSIGVKTAINHFGNRNRLGSYFPPLSVYLDRTFLRTLDRRHLSNGLGEILKMALIKDERLFELLEAHGQSLISEKFQNGGVAQETIDRAIQTMLEELQPNLWEKDLKRSVDFGHSFSPMIEMRVLPQLTHGEAVTLDMLLSCLISNSRGFLGDADLERIFRVTKSLDLPTYHPMFTDPVALQEALADTVTHRNGAQNLPMIPHIGSYTFFYDVTPGEIASAARRLSERHLHAKG